MKSSAVRTRAAGYVLGAVLILVALYLWGDAQFEPKDAAEADGDPDAGALELVAFIVAGGVALAVYAVMIAVLERLIRSRAKRAR